MKEKTIENRLRKWALARGWRVIKFTPRGDVGWPDRIFIWKDGTHVWLELKRPGEEPEPIQFFRISLLRRSKCNVDWFDNFEQAVEYLKLFELGEL